MSASRLVVATAVVGLLATACTAGPDEAASTTTADARTTLPPSERTSASTASPAPTTTAATSTTEFVRTPGPPTLVLVDAGDLVAVDLVDLTKVVLAEGSALAASLGVAQGSFDGVDLSPDGSTVAFTYGGFVHDQSSRGFADGPSAHGLYEVPVDRSAAPTRLLTTRPRATATGLAAPAYGPDGSLLAVFTDSHLVVLGRDREPTGPGVELPLPPVRVTWSPDGRRLVWLNTSGREAGRTPCCGISSVDVDPTTGRIVSDRTSETTAGVPYFDPSGRLGALPMQSGYSMDVDATGRFVVSAGGTGSRQFEWFDTTATDQAPTRFGLEVDVSEGGPIAW